MRKTRPIRALAIMAIAGLAVAACGSSSKKTATTTAGAAAASGGFANCPNGTVVAQADWFPEVDHWELYASMDPTTAQIKGDRVVGDMIDGTGKKVGVKLEIRNGGPATQFELVTATMYKDPSILLGMIQTDESVRFAKSQPTVAVIAPRERSPQIIMWDPATYPNVKTIADLKPLKVKVRYFKDATYMAYLTGTGILDPSQVDDSYNGKPDAFIADGGKSAQQGFATAEPYSYEHDITQWMKPIKYQLIADTGYDLYPESLNVKPDSITKYGDCLKAVVPILQQNILKMKTNPGPVEDFIVKVVAQQNSGWIYTRAQADAAVKASLDNGIVSNGPDKTVGNFDMTTIQKIIDADKPIFAALNDPIKDGLRPEDVATNQFVDTKIGL